jgi:hypothetical protein
VRGGRRRRSDSPPTISRRRTAVSGRRIGRCEHAGNVVQLHPSPRGDVEHGAIDRNLSTLTELRQLDRGHRPRDLAPLHVHPRHVGGRRGGRRRLGRGLGWWCSRCGYPHGVNTAGFSTLRDAVDGDAELPGTMRALPAAARKLRREGEGSLAMRTVDARIHGRIGRYRRDGRYESRRHDGTRHANSQRFAQVAVDECLTILGPDGSLAIVSIRSPRMSRGSPLASQVYPFRVRRDHPSTYGCRIKASFRAP